jgi:hypothetical protein
MTPPHGKFDPDDMTDVQEAFLVGMTDQRAANIWEAADFFADLSPEARAFLRGADKEKIEELESTLRFMNATGIIWKFLWAGGAVIFGLAVGITQAWEWLSKHLTFK